MNRRKEEYYILTGLLLAVLSCAAGWLALPQVQPLLDTWRQNPLFWPFVGVVGGLLVVLVLLLPFIDWGAILVLLRQLFPQQRFETRYLQAVDTYLRHTPALLVISERAEHRTDLDLLQAYSQLSLAPDPDEPTPLASPADQARRGGGLLGLRADAEHDLAGARSLVQAMTAVLLWLAVHAALLTIALLLLARLLWEPGSGLRLQWGSGLLALLVVLLWLALVVLLHRVVMPRLGQHWTSRRAVSANPGSPGAEIWQHPRLLIQGHPGSGKTTLLRHIAVVCANELLKKRHRVHLRDAYGWPTCPFPIYMPLRALRDASVSGTQSLLASYIETLHDLALLGPDVARTCPRDFFERRLARGGCIILLDAFDELRDAAARQRLGRLVQDLPPGPPHLPNRIVVTSRIVGYEGQLRGKGFTHRYLADLDTAQTEAFIRSRYRALAHLTVRAAGEPGGVRWDPDVRARRLISRLPTNPGLRRLGRNPFLLALMVSVHLKSPRELPRQRHALYARALDLLVEEWERWKDEEWDLQPTTPEADLDKSQKLHLLAELAWIMYEKTVATSDDRSHTVISGSEAEEILAHALAGIPTITAGRSGDLLTAHCRSEACRWLRNLGQRGGVLQELGNIRGSNDVEIQFAHQTFQEYLASQAIDHTSADDQQRRTARLRERWNDARWREVVLLYAATCADASPLVQHVLQQRHPQADLLAGAVLAESGVVKDSTLQPETLTRLAHIALKAPDMPPTTALEALHTLAEVQGSFGQHTLIDAIFSAPHHAVRIRSIELLAKMEPNRPAPAPLDAPVQAALLRLLSTETDPGLRLAAGFALARGDPRYAGDGCLPRLVEVPAGPFLMGSRADDPEAEKREQPQHTRTLPGYWIGATPVTNAQWRRFIDAGGYTTRRYWSRAGWRWRLCGWEPAEAYTPPQTVALLILGPLFDSIVGLLLRRAPFTQPWAKTWDDPNWNGDNQPVVGVSFYEAEAYCRWLSEATGHAFVVPSEEEWEKAARGPNGRIWPWGNTWEAGRCNSSEAGLGRTAPVGSYPAGNSPYGAQDLAGNVWEWCRTRYKQNYPGRSVDWEDRLYNMLAVWGRAYVERGGAWGWGHKYVRGASRFKFLPRDRVNIIGFRLASHSPPHSDAGF